MRIYLVNANDDGSIDVLTRVEGDDRFGAVYRRIEKEGEFCGRRVDELREALLERGYVDIEGAPE